MPLSLKHKKQIARNNKAMKSYLGGNDERKNTKEDNNIY